VTHLFRDVLHGWGQLLLCVNVSPAARDYDETARVLRYAAVAAQVGTAARAQPPLRVLRRGPLRAPCLARRHPLRPLRRPRARRRRRFHSGAIARSVPCGVACRCCKHHAEAPEQSALYCWRYTDISLTP